MLCTPSGGGKAPTTTQNCLLHLAALNHPHSFSCKLELGSDQEIPTDWYPFATMEFEVADTVVSQTSVRSLGTESDIQPQKHVSSRAYYHCQVSGKNKTHHSHYCQFKCLILLLLTKITFKMKRY